MEAILAQEVLILDLQMVEMEDPHHPMVGYLEHPMVSQGHLLLVLQMEVAMVAMEKDQPHPMEAILAQVVQILDLPMVETLMAMEEDQPHPMEAILAQVV